MLNSTEYKIFVNMINTLSESLKAFLRVRGKMSGTPFIHVLIYSSCAGLSAVKEFEYEYFYH